MFVKRSINPYFVETSEEDVKIEVKIESIKKYSVEPEIRNFGSKKPLLLTRTKDEHSHVLESVVKMVQKLSNKIVDMEKEKEAKK